MHGFFDPRRFGALALALGLATGLSACSDPDEGGPEPIGDVADPADSEAPLTDLDALLEGAPDNSTLPQEGKTDQVLPEKFDVRDTQSAVKSQGSRGVCSIFSTVGLMEHLYIAEGTITNPDFSEQYLQWSAKEQVGRFKNTSGSNASVNLEAINRFGVVTEDVYPYRSSPWGSSDDAECTGGDDQPTKCYTQGEPPQEALDARKWKLPRSRFVNSRPRNIKAYMMEKKTGVVAGMTFFYQSWNHRSSSLPTNNQYWSEGYVLPPNDVDRQKSLEKRAGHSILLIGWDDNLEVPLVDDKGEVITDANGEPKVEKGFFLFKNSWGTSGFGIRHEAGAGYGWIAYSYVEEFASVNTAPLPEVELDPEVCDDGTDNNLDNLSDCADPMCANAEACRADGGLTFNNMDAAAIPDNDSTGVTSTIQVDQPGAVDKILVNVDISHTFRGDLTVTLTSPDGTEAVLHNRDGGGDDNLVAAFSPEAFVGRSIQGAWKLTVSDGAAEDTGTLNGWSLEFELGGDVPAEACGDGIDNDGNGDADCGDAACAASEACQGASTLDFDNTDGLDIPDNDPAGVISTIEVTDAGVISNLSVSVDITHTFRGDLVVSLEHEGGASVTLHNKTGDNNDDLIQTWTPTEFNGEAAAGTWKLKVSDHGAQDTGRVNIWGLQMNVVPE